MIDIIVLALKADQFRAEKILEGLHVTGVAGRNRARVLFVDPADKNWRAVVKDVASCRCVIFCWSKATQAEVGQRLSDLAVRAMQNGTAIAVELDANTRPESLTDCTTYPMYGYRSGINAWSAILFGNAFVAEIAAAAERKVAGQDLLSPQAIWMLVRKRVWAWSGGVAFALGILAALLQFYRDPEFSKWLEPDVASAFEQAKTSGSCQKMRQFMSKHGDSAWRENALAFLATCSSKEVNETVVETTKLPAFGATREDVLIDGRRMCQDLAENLHGKLIDVTIFDFVASQHATVNCKVQRTISKPVESAN